MLLVPFSASHCRDFVPAPASFLCPDCSNISEVLRPCAELHQYFVYSFFLLAGSKGLWQGSPVVRGSQLKLPEMFATICW